MQQSMCSSQQHMHSVTVEILQLYKTLRFKQIVIDSMEYVIMNYCIEGVS